MKRSLLLQMIAVLVLLFAFYIRVYLHYPPEIWNLLQIATLIMIFMYPSWLVLFMMLMVTWLLIYVGELVSIRGIFPSRMAIFSVVTNGVLLAVVTYYRIQSNTAMSKLENLSLQDPLTQLWNRRYLREYVEKNFPNWEQGEQEHSVIMCDVDYFKSINDTYGHAVGDDVIQAVAIILKRNIRAEDVPVRVGGEEFLLFLPHTTGEQAVLVAERIRQAVIKLCEDKNDLFPTFTLSLGVSAYQKKGTFADLLHRADQALYNAKKLGRNRTYFLQETE